MSGEVKVTLEELAQLALYRAILAEIVAKAGGEIIINLNPKAAPLFISYCVQQEKNGGDAIIKINAEHVLNIH